MAQYDEFRIFITEGLSPLNKVAATAFRQPAFCILQTPVCPSSNDIVDPEPLQKPWTNGTFPPPPAECPYDFSDIAELTILAGHWMELDRLIYAENDGSGNYLFRDIDKLDESIRPASITFDVPSHFKEMAVGTFMSEQEGTYTITFNVEYSGGRNCSGSFNITII